MTVKIPSLLPVSHMSVTMSSRDHPFNRSTRPLLMDRKPQLLLKKKTDNNTVVHGFNDFDIMSQQYRNLTTHIGYPYGSPPSPTVNSSDFTFSDDTSSIYSTSTPKVYASTVVDNFRVDTCSKSTNFDDFNNWRRVGRGSALPMFGEHRDNTNGPFIFGVHNANTFPVNNSTVINTTKYSTEDMKPVLNHSNSDSSSSSRGTEKDYSLLVKNSNDVKKRNRKDKKFNKENKPRIKCVLVGDGAVGKTNLIMSYLENRFTSDYNPTASDIFNAEVMVNDSPVHITICDTAGQDTLDPLRELCYPDSNVFMLCFSVVKPDSFQSIKTKWIPKFSKTKAALILVGTQADLRADNFVLNELQMQGERPIAAKDAWDLATTIGAKYIETSSLKQKNVKDVFDAAIWDALLPNHLPPTPPLWKKLFCLV